MRQAPTDTDDDLPATRQRRDLLNSSIKENYAHLCASALAVIHKGRYGSREQQMIDLAEDVVHEAIGRALAKAAQYDPSKRPVPWLMRFILNVLKESNRRVRRQPRQSDLGDLAWNQLLDALGVGTRSAAVVELLPRLDRALGKVTTEEREILHLRFNKGFSGQELAQAVGAPSPDAAGVRLCRALKALRDAFFMLANQEEG